MIWKRWPARRSAAQPLPSGQTARDVDLAAAIDAASHGSWETVGELVGLLAGIDAAADVTTAGSVLRALADAPRALARLEEHSRQHMWRSPQNAPLIAAVVARLVDGTIGPVGLALTSMSRDGRLREAAVRRMLAAPAPELMPYLALRTADVDVTRFARAAAAPRRSRTVPQVPRIPSDELAGLQELVQRADAVLDAETTALLRTWMSR